MDIKLFKIMIVTLMIISIVISVDCQGDSRPSEETKRQFRERCVTRKDKIKFRDCMNFLGEIAPIVNESFEMMGSLTNRLNQDHLA